MAFNHHPISGRTYFDVFFDVLSKLEGFWDWVYDDRAVKDGYGHNPTIGHGIALGVQELENGQHKQALAPGMQVQAEIKLGRRAVLEYLLSPVQRAWQEAGRER